MAARYPGATFKPLGRQSEPRMVAHDIICAHTMVSSMAEADRYFRTLNGPGYDGTESHYGVGGAWRDDVPAALDGVVWQWQDRAHQADANGPDGNGRVISIETADNAPKRAADIAPWTPLQVEALVDLLVWECSPAAHAGCPAGWDCRQGMTWRGVRVAIPPVLIPDTKPGRRGLAVHRQGVRHSRGLDVPGFLATGGQRWSKSTGKECPGDARVRQFVEVVIPEVQRRILVPPTPPTDTTENDMTPQDLLKLLNETTLPLGDGNADLLGQADKRVNLGELLVAAAGHSAATNRHLAEQNELLRELVERLAPPAP
jgi:hypothetical protein